MFALSSSFPFLLLARCCHGVASSCVCVAGMGLVARAHHGRDEERARVIGRALGGMAVGVLVGYPLGGIVYDAFGGEEVGKAAPFVAVAAAAMAIVGRLTNRIFAVPIQTVFPVKT